ncbi:phage tail protein [Escherichia coli]|uniref:phage tail protein n=1 Tax=Escherichia coli TaxID=562 RepID=UPI0028789109|nr:phage tail protein [Escherichia coli]MDS1619841.1 phage tail protein [Escherichia coli]
MLKADILREHITRHIPWVVSNPENLVIQVQKGQVCASGRPGTAFEYRYTLCVAVLDYPDDIDLLTLAIMTWARDHQPELIFNPDKSLRDIAFNVDILDNNTADVAFMLPLTEAVIVTTDEQGHFIFTPLDEPDYRELYGIPEDVWAQATEGHAMS